MQSPQCQQVTKPYNELISSLGVLRRARSRLSQNGDAESAVALQAARTLSTTVESCISGSISILGRSSIRTRSTATSAPLPKSEEPPAELTSPTRLRNPVQTNIAQQNDFPEALSQSSNTEHVVDQSRHQNTHREDPYVISQIPEVQDREDSGYASVTESSTVNYSSSLLPASSNQLRIEAQRLLQSHGYPTSPVGRFTKTNSYKQALKWAASEGHLEAVKYLIDQGTKFSIRSLIGAASLSAAIDSGHTEVVKFLLTIVSHAEFAGSPQAHDALRTAASHGDYAVVVILLDRGADPNSKRKNQPYPLHIAACHGYLNVTKQLLLKNADVFAKDEAKRTPLHLAIAAGSAAVTRSLLKHRSETNVKDSAGDSPFQTAFRYGQVDIFNCLIQFSAKLQLSNDGFVRSKALDQLLDGKLQPGFRAFVECMHDQNLLTYSRIEEVVQYVAIGNHRDALKYLCDKEVLTGPHSSNTANFEIEKPEKSLYSPRRNRSIETVTTLLPAYEENYKYHGVDVLYEHDDVLEDQQGRNEQVLKQAVDAKDGRIFREKLDQMKSAPGHPTWPISANTLCHVVQKGDLGMLQALFWTKVDINGTDSTGWAAIHHAAWARNMLDKLLVLHSAGADLNVQTSDFRSGHEAGETALSLVLRKKAETSSNWRSKRDMMYWEQVCLALHTRGANAGDDRDVLLNDGTMLRIPSSSVQVLSRKISAI